MKRPRKNYIPRPAIKADLMCARKHAWSVRDLNPELKAVKCPVCGSYTDIEKGKL